MRVYALFAGAVMAAPSAGTAQVRRTADSVQRYMEEALDTLQRVALRRDSVDWRALRDSVFARTLGAQATAETWPALQWALQQIDRHSFLQTPEPARAPAAPNAQSTARPPGLAGRLIDGRFGYVRVPGIGRSRTSFVDSLQMFVSEHQSAGACGWMVDLRANPGGNMWPMLAGVGALLGDSIFGSFVVAGQRDTPWRYKAGAAWSGPDTMPDWAVRGSRPAPVLRDRYAPVALLIGRTTGSSGEATAIAFMGRPNVRSFGDSTAGYATINSGYRLRDGANMVVTIGFSKDRTGKQYGIRLTPDEYLASPADDTPDRALERATQWLGAQSACRR